MNKAVSSGKINNICRQYDLHQIINEHTHFTERSSSLIDIILTSNPNSILLSGVGDPFLNQEIRYHCPIFSVFKFTNPIENQLKGIYGSTKMGTMRISSTSLAILTGTHSQMKTLIYILKT